MPKAQRVSKTISMNFEDTKNNDTLVNVSSGETEEKMDSPSDIDNHNHASLQLTSIKLNTTIKTSKLLTTGSVKAHLQRLSQPLRYSHIKTSIKIWSIFFYPEVPR
jgi:hypothetical protein